MADPIPSPSQHDEAAERYLKRQQDLCKHITEQFVKLGAEYRRLFYSGDAMRDALRKKGLSPSFSFHSPYVRAAQIIVITN
jgi:hypothetical protein